MVTALRSTTIIVAGIGIVIGIISLMIGMTSGSTGFFISFTVKLFSVVAIIMFLLFIIGLLM